MKRKQNLFITVVLLSSIIFTQMPLTAFAAPTQDASIELNAETETLQEEADREENTEPDLKAEFENDNLPKEELELSKEENTSIEEENSQTDIEEATQKQTEAEEFVSEEATQVQTETEESSAEEQTDIEERLLASDTDFVIQDGVLKQYTGTEIDIVIPEGVTKIGAKAFSGNKAIRTIVFSSTVTEIESTYAYPGAFSNCDSLKEVILNEGLETIGDNAFYQTPLGEVLDTGEEVHSILTIPSTVQKIGINAFNRCKYLGEIKFENGENKLLQISGILTSGGITTGIFESCSSLTGIELPDRLKQIPSYTFQKCASLDKIVFGNAIETIGDYAFYECTSLKSVILPATVVTIGERAFSGCSSLKEMTLNEGLETIKDDAFYGAAFGELLDTGKIETGTLTIPSTVQHIGYAFRKCTYLGEVIFANGENQILDTPFSFSECEHLNKVTLPNRLKTVQRFDGCTNLQEVILGDAVEEIGDTAFKGCNKLEHIELPPTVKRIGVEAFRNCSSLKSLTLNEGLKTIAQYAFSNAALGEESAGIMTLGTLTIPSTVQNIGEGAFQECPYLGEVVFVNGNTVILQLNSINQAQKISGVFNNCKNLKKVSLPDRLKEIPEETFAYCTNLQEVTFGNGLEEIGESAFENCGLKNIELPLTVKTIGGNAFYACGSLEEVILNEGLKSIGRFAFSGAKFAGTGTLIIPSTVQSIGEAAFRACSDLEEIAFDNGETIALTISSGNFPAFGDCMELTTLLLPERITEIRDAWFEHNRNLTILYIPQNVTQIDINPANFPNLIIFGVPGSYAEIYADTKEIPFRDKKVLEEIWLFPTVIEETGEEVIGKQIQLLAKIFLPVMRNRQFIYQSDNEEIVTVDETGLVTIQGYGDTQITVMTADGTKKAQCEVHIRQEDKPTIDVPEDKEDKPTINNVVFPGKTTSYSAIYTGEQIRPVMTVSYQYIDDSGKEKIQKLKLNTDYTVRYYNNVNAGENTAKVTVRGIGEFTGTITKEFTIQPKSISGVTLSPVGDIVYGEEPSVIVTDGNLELIAGRDYDVELSTSGFADMDTESVLTVKGIGNYTGISKKNAKFNILRTNTELLPITDKTIRVAFKQLPAKGFTYNAKAQKPAVIVTDIATGKKLPSNCYKVVYTNNINAGNEAKAWVVGVSKNGKGYYGISEPLTFPIKQKDFSKLSVSAVSAIPKTGNIDDIKSAINEAIVVKDGKRTLMEDAYTIDYGTISEVQDIKIGQKYSVILTPKAGGNYVDESKKIVSIKFGQLNLASKTAKVSVRITNTSNNQVVVRYNGITLVENRDYTAEIKSNKDQNTYTVKIKAVKGSAYKGSRTIKSLTQGQ